MPHVLVVAAFQLGEPGLRIELVVAEPLVVDPVAFAFDENRRLYVVEDRGYPDPIGKPDRDGSAAITNRMTTEYACSIPYGRTLPAWARSDIRQ